MSAIGTVGLCIISFWWGWIGGHNWLHKRTKDDGAVVATLAKHMASLNDKMRFVGPGVNGEVRMTVDHKGRKFDIVVETANIEALPANVRRGA
ncbi:MAG: hypothetical protein V4523_07930 [Pseudomonadota bacterium]